MPHRPRSQITSISWAPRSIAHGLSSAAGHYRPEALFDYAARDEIPGWPEESRLDPKNVKYVILSHAHGDHDAGRIAAGLDSGVHVVYGAEDGMPWINAPAARRSMTWWALTG
jgi:glyoxylase-like metal-dependent hydrolase (beta-lactamase superfamily II)